MTDKNRNLLRTRPSTAYLTAILVIAGMIAATAGYFLLTRDELNSPVSARIDSLPGVKESARPAPDYSIETLDGREIKLSSFRGNVVVVDFWASWCLPCRDEVPLLVQFARDHGNHGLEIIGLSIEDPEEEIEAVRQFVKQFSVNYTVGFAAEEMLASFAGEGDRPIPQTFIFDKSGMLREHLVGFSPTSDGRRLKRTISRLLSD